VSLADICSVAALISSAMSAASVAAERIAPTKPRSAPSIPRSAPERCATSPAPSWKVTVSVKSPWATRAAAPAISVTGSVTCRCSQPPTASSEAVKTSASNSAARRMMRPAPVADA
jgi:hypothetical protein